MMISLELITQLLSGSRISCIKAANMCQYDPTLLVFIKTDITETTEAYLKILKFTLKFLINFVSNKSFDV